MVSEFTVKLIQEVQKREILYNTKYEKRSKAEKDKNWAEIADILNCTTHKAKNHWKNVRDRFVKIMHAREKHLAQNGRADEAPSYIYWNNLLFLKEFSIKKDYCNLVIPIEEIEPDPLLSGETDGCIDYTSEFLEAVQKHVALYDSLAEMRKYKGLNEWKAVEASLDYKFSVSILRDYWIKLMKKYKLYQANREHLGAINNEHIFKEMSFVNESCEEYIEEDEDEQITIEFEEDESDEMLQEEILDEPATKRLKIDKVYEEELSQYEIIAPSQINQKDDLDEFDYFAKRVSLQLKKIANKNLNSARKAEIEILKLLMDYENAS